MSYEMEEKTGTLFKNENKTEDKHPNYKGSFKLDGKVMDIALWRKEGKSGVPYLFVKVSDKKEKPANDSWDNSVANDDYISF